MNILILQVVLFLFEMLIYRNTASNFEKRFAFKACVLATQNGI